MTEIYPDYYKDFACTASCCKHSCCENWEIDIDDDSYKKYVELKGPLYEKLKSCICEDEDGCHSFKLLDNGRCPFLDGNNLCELINEYGENILCDICREHPRFHNYYRDITESGVGLCCEEAARIIITRNNPISYINSDKVCFTDENDTTIQSLRKKIFGILHNSTLKYFEKINKILAISYLTNECIDSNKYAKKIRNLETLDPEWSNILSDYINSNNSESKDVCDISIPEIYFSNILEYFIYRYFFQIFLGTDPSTVFLFAVQSTELIRNLCISDCAHGKMFTENLILNYARMYSSEIEYSDSNIDEIFSCIDLWTIN